MHALDHAAADTPEIILAALERVSEAIVIVDGKGQVIYFNSAAEAIWGMDRAEMLGRHAGCLGLKDCQLQDAAVSGERDVDSEGNGCEIVIRRADSRKVRAMLSVSHIDEGSERRTVAIVRDVTTEIELRERLALVSLIADGTNRAVVVTDPKLRIVYSNAALSGMLAYSPDEVKGRQLPELLVGRHTN